MVVGCSAKEFWYEDPSLLSAYSKAYELRLKDSIDKWKMKVNFTAWINGVYIQSAVASVLSKNVHFPQKPFDLFETETMTQQQKIYESEEAIKRRSKQIDEMLTKNKKTSS